LSIGRETEPRRVSFAFSKFIQAGVELRLKLDTVWCLELIVVAHPVLYNSCLINRHHCGKRNVELQEQRLTIWSAEKAFNENLHHDDWLGVQSVEAVQRLGLVTLTIIDIDFVVFRASSGRKN
jgi:hypothetical protein